MLYEQYPFQDLLTPSSINDGGVSKLDSSLTSLDFYLLDDINTYLSPNELEKPKNNLFNDSIHNNNQHHQEEEDFLSEFNFSEFITEESEFLKIDQLEIEKWISQSSFPSPPMEINNSPISSIVEDTSFEQYPINTDMIVPPSPSISSFSLSSSSSSSPESGSMIKKTKLSTTERKLRKKDQNKTAAEKYRIRKKSERNQLLDRHLKLKNLNKDLKLELENLSYRVQQFKQLFSDLIQT